MLFVASKIELIINFPYRIESLMIFEDLMNMSMGY